MAVTVDGTRDIPGIWAGDVIIRHMWKDAEHRPAQATEHTAA
jgi:hypothetical protein